VTTILVALSAIERGDPLALRMAVEAMGDAINVLRGESRARDQRSSEPRSRHGASRNKFEAFDPERRGGDYLTKDRAWGFLVACPRWPACRRRGCVVDRFAW
jgi:hypothetical protein